MKKKMLRLWYGYWANINFDPKYIYKRITIKSIPLFEIQHKIFIIDGWEKASDFLYGFLSVKIWYRKRKQ